MYNTYNTWLGTLHNTNLYKSPLHHCNIYPPYVRIILPSPLLKNYTSSHTILHLIPSLCGGGDVHTKRMIIPTSLTYTPLQVAPWYYSCCDPYGCPHCSIILLQQCTIESFILRWNCCNWSLEGRWSLIPTDVNMSVWCTWQILPGYANNTLGRRWSYKK